MKRVLVLKFVDKKGKQTLDLIEDFLELLKSVQFYVFVLKCKCIHALFRRICNFSIGRKRDLVLKRIDAEKEN